MRGRLYGVVARALGQRPDTLRQRVKLAQGGQGVPRCGGGLPPHPGTTPGRASGDVIFTGGATESNNIIIHSVLERARGRGVVLTTKVEHPSVLQPLLHVRKASRGGVKVVQLPVDREGFVRMDSLREAVKKWGGRIKLVSVIYANNEIGTVQDMGAIRRAVGKGVHIHADTTQERGVRPGTESPPLIASLAQAASINMSRAGRARGAHTRYWDMAWGGVPRTLS
eukprot:jgi/Mesvir1/26377/Mv23107-RA.1